MESYTERILITGALGQIGTELTNRLVEMHGADNVEIGRASCRERV